MALIAVSGHPGCRFEEVARLASRVASIPAPAILPGVEELETYGPSWERCRQAFTTAASRGEALALLRKA